VTLSLELGGIRDPAVQRNFQTIALRWPDRTPTYPTASRPAPGMSGRGAMIYDTTLSKPLWSDGTVWRDATGAAV